MSAFQHLVIFKVISINPHPSKRVKHADCDFKTWCTTHWSSPLNQLEWMEKFKSRFIGKQTAAQESRFQVWESRANCHSHRRKPKESQRQLVLRFAWQTIPRRSIFWCPILARTQIRIIFNFHGLTGQKTESVFKGK